MIEDKKYNIYFLRDPYSNKIRYVGLSHNVEKRFKNI